MRVGLIGFGRTGRSVATVLLRDDACSLSWILRRSRRLEGRSVAEILGEEADASALIFSRETTSAATLLDAQPVDVVIDFSSESGLDLYADAAAERGVAIVTAVSHYSDAAQRRLRDLGQRTRVLWSPNITLGVNFVMLAAQTLQRIAPELDVHVVEEHFREKSGVSGTATRLAETLGLAPEQVHSIRAGGIIGVHEVLFGFPSQTVRLRHEAISREAFGGGAVFAARHLVERPAGLYRLEDLLIPYFALDVPLISPEVRVVRGWRRRGARRLRALAQRLERRSPRSEAPTWNLEAISAVSTSSDAPRASWRDLSTIDEISEVVAP
ncbi:MAG: saccharopine dehydrogenase NADP-binding domain-containing protein [Acidobacteriota bacterium]|nr:saccharopine dehydrogenase NADP-binding domain-containing protein [Acidobacteriota bacterium]MDE3043428.1 saccharopine dehydrogenase NADP-binding domain-containing protein [Acidobacteriota bacterium]MDE3107240.1 saccharopine dehydrogenase NADP-binding domain-containing protein [Acidobacteriota bacterium]MDE3222335.1 saccharopine dehydrogenase NADP-binding domain-containing protein [Acidobacteriota bacterium]